MDITEVRIKLMADSDDRLAAFCSITFDNCFVVRDLKIIEGTSGLFVAMPSRKLTAHCPGCGGKNHLRSQFCNNCGRKLKEDQVLRDSEGRAKLYADIAHPINSTCREMIQSRVIAEFQSERERAKEPGYVSKYDEQYPEDAETSVWLPPAADESTPPKPGAARPESPPLESPRLPEGSHVEAAEPEPPPPHSPPSSRQPGDKKKGGEFGAGIFGE